MLEQHAPPARARRIEACAWRAVMYAGALEQITPVRNVPLLACRLSARRVDPTGFADGGDSPSAGTRIPALNESRDCRGLWNAEADAGQFLGPQLLNLRTFPTLMGYSSRILAESWESTISSIGRHWPTS